MVLTDSASSLVKSTGIRAPQPSARVTTKTGVSGRISRLVKPSDRQCSEGGVSVNVVSYVFHHTDVMVPVIRTSDSSMTLGIFVPSPRSDDTPALTRAAAAVVS